MMVCWFCGAEAEAGPRPSRDKTCAKCHVSLRCCKNCSFFDPPSHNQCREPAAEWVRDKELANFCEFFEFRDEAKRPGKEPAEDARKRFDDLFKR